MTKRKSPLQVINEALKKRDAAKEQAQKTLEAITWAWVEKAKADRDEIKRAKTDPNLSPEERLKIFKSVQAWPRIVLGLYEAEREIAENAGEDGEPSDTAYQKVGEIVELGDDRVKALCNEGRQHLREGMSANMKIKMTAAEFEERILRRKKSKAD